MRNERSCEYYAKHLRRRHGRHSGPRIILFAATAVRPAELRIVSVGITRSDLLRRKLPGKAKLRTSRKSIEIGAGAAVGTYRYHAVVNTLSRKKSRKLIKLGGAENASGALFAAGPSGRIPDGTMKNRKIRTRAPTLVSCGRV